MNRVAIKGLKNLVLILVFLTTALAGTSWAQTYNLQAGVIMKTMPDGRVVPMWGFGPVGGLITVPGPPLIAAGGNLTINLTNNLPVPVSIIIPNLPGAMIPTWTDGTTGARTSPGQRVRSLTHETAPGTTGAYTWTNVTPGTHLYKSGTHQQVQVGMGLYGAVVGPAYPGIPFTNQIVLLFSDVDPVLNDAVANGNYNNVFINIPPSIPNPVAGAPVTSTIDRQPEYFLINGEPFSYASSPIPAGTEGQTTLLRFLNAGYQGYVPVLQGVFMQVVAEDGHLYPFPKNQYSLQLSPGRTMDAIITNPAAGYIPLYDRRLHLTNSTSSPGGMFTYLQIAGPVANLTANTAGSGTGRIQVVSLPGGINCSSAVPANDPVGCTEAYNSGITISVAAIPDQGSEFTGWSGDLTGVVSPSPLTMDANKAITGTFDLLPAITVTSPNGGESLRRGTTVPITWTYVSDPGAFVAIQLLQGTKVIKNITRRVGVAIGSGGTGSFNWRIPRFFRRLGSNFKVKITSTTVPIATDTSDNDFSFVP
jgi:FtsP/CotA-like multicopper oxidase with cupredoxin domain